MLLLPFCSQKGRRCYSASLKVVLARNIDGAAGGLFIYGMRQADNVLVAAKESDFLLMRLRLEKFVNLTALLECFDICIFSLLTIDT